MSNPQRGNYCKALGVLMDSIYSIYVLIIVLKNDPDEVFDISFKMFYETYWLATFLGGERVKTPTQANLKQF